MKNQLWMLLVLMGALAAGCGKDAVDAASDEAAESTAHTGGKLAPGVSPFGASADPKANGSRATRSGPPTAPPPQLAPGQGVGTLYGRKPEAKSNPDLDLPK